MGQVCVGQGADVGQGVDVAQQHLSARGWGVRGAGPGSPEGLRTARGWGWVQGEPEGLEPGPCGAGEPRGARFTSESRDTSGSGCTSGVWIYLRGLDVPRGLDLPQRVGFTSGVWIYLRVGMYLRGPARPWELPTKGEHGSASPLSQPTLNPGSPRTPPAAHPPLRSARAAAPALLPRRVRPL